MTNVLVNISRKLLDDVAGEGNMISKAKKTVDKVWERRHEVFPIFFIEEETIIYLASR